MKKQSLQKLGRAGCIALAAVFALSAPNAAYASASSTRKDETVYVSLDPSGNTQSTIVSDWLHTEDSSQRIADRSDLSNIQNVKTDEKALRQGDSLSWALNTDNSGKNIYYQGTTDKKTPLAVTVTYTLDGKPVTANEIAGKSGKVTISLTMKNTDARTVTVRGKNVVMDTPMTAIAAATLPSDTFKNVTISSGKMLSEGNNQFVVFLTMPGLSDSLGLKNCGFPELSGLDFPETLTIEADAVKFKLPSIAVAATPKLADSDKLMKSDDINDLTANLNKLKSIQSNLENADPQKNISSLITDPDRTAAARLLVDDVFDFYSLDTKALDILPEYVNDSSIQLCDRVTSDLNKADLKYLIDNHVLTGAKSSLSGFDAKKAQALMNDYTTLSTFDTSKLSGVKKVLSDYEKIGGGLNSVLQDTGNLLNHASTGSLSTLGALGSSDVKLGLSGTLKSMNSLSDTLASSGVSSDITFQSEDIQALLESYLGRNFSTLAAQTIGNNSTDGNISVAKLSATMQTLGLSTGSMITALSSTQTGQAALQNLLSSFLSLNSAATIPASSLSQIQPGGALDSATLQAIESAVSHQSGLIGKNGTINVATLLSMMPAMQKSGVSAAAIANLEMQIIPIALQANPNAVISDGAVETALGAVLSSMDDKQKDALISSIAGSLASELTPSVNSLLSNSASLQKSLKSELGSDYASELSSAMSSLSSSKPYLEDLETDLGKITWNKQTDINSCIEEAEALLSDKSNLDYLASWAGKLDGMKTDLDGNRNNIAVLTNLMKTAGNPKVKAFGAMLPALQTDLTDAYSASRPLLNALNQPEISASLHQLPATANTLMKIEKDVNSNRELMNIFRQTTNPSTVSLLRTSLNSLSSLQGSGTAALTAKLDSAQDLLARKDAYVKLADQNSIFTEAADGASTELKFVYKTAEIKEPEAQPATVKTVAASQKSQSGSGFWGWLKSLFLR